MENEDKIKKAQIEVSNISDLLSIEAKIDIMFDLIAAEHIIKYPDHTNEFIEYLNRRCDWSKVENNKK